MFLFIIRRLVLAIPVLFGLIVLTFLMIRVVPTDPAAALAGDQATPAQIEAIREHYGFNKPLSEQFWLYFKQIMGGSFGTSYVTQRPVMEDIEARIPATLELALFAMTIAIVFGIPLGLLAAAHHNRLLDHALRVFSVCGLAIASFWLGLMLQLVFGMELGLLPVHQQLSSNLNAPPFFTGMYLVDSLIAGQWNVFGNAFAHIIMPGVTLALGPMATIVRFTRSGVLSTLQTEYIAYGRAAGYPSRTLMLKYVLRNSVVTTVTQIGLLLGSVIAGAVVVEAIFDWPGLGDYAVSAILSSDYQATIAVVFVIGIFYAIVNILVDIVHAIIDPRVMEQL